MPDRKRFGTLRALENDGESRNRSADGGRGHQQAGFVFALIDQTNQTTRTPAARAADPPVKPVPRGPNRHFFARAAISFARYALLLRSKSLTLPKPPCELFLSSCSLSSHLSRQRRM